MRALIQRVSEATVSVNEEEISYINSGLLVLLGVGQDDNEMDIKWLSEKIINLRVFNDIDGKMNLSLNQIDGDLLVVSQFTLMASTRKGTRPSYIKAAKPELAEKLYLQFVQNCMTLMGKSVKMGTFGAHMNVSLVNNGPVTIWLDSKSKG